MDEENDKLVTGWDPGKNAWKAKLLHGVNTDNSGVLELKIERSRWWFALFAPKNVVCIVNQPASTGQWKKMTRGFRSGRQWCKRMLNGFRIWIMGQHHLHHWWTFKMTMKGEPGSTEKLPASAERFPLASGGYSTRQFGEPKVQFPPFSNGLFKTLWLIWKNPKGKSL